MAKKILVAPVAGQDHQLVVSFTEVKPENAGLLFQPTLSGKVYLTKNSLSDWDGASPLTITVS